MANQGIIILKGFGGLHILQVHYILDSALSVVIYFAGDEIAFV